MKTQKSANWFEEWTRWAGARKVAGTEKLRLAVQDLVQAHVMGEYIAEEMACNVFDHADWNAIMASEVAHNRSSETDKASVRGKKEHEWQPLKTHMIEAVKSEVDRTQGLKRGALQYIGEAIRAWNWIGRPTSKKGRVEIAEWGASVFGLRFWLTGARSDKHREAVIVALLESGYVEKSVILDAYAELRHPLAYRHHKRNPGKRWSPETWPESWEAAWNAGEKSKLQSSQGLSGQKRRQRKAL